ncbi:Di-trans [Hexamita inflata]|uniref:Di-trans n=1 Tax=Hexamita inflata TaxID=28002 RepID=A0AA86UQK4_9EUKA|nr:Di-trans [Hexamita inflata]
MWRKLLQNQSHIGLPRHVAIVLDGNRTLHYSNSTDIDLLPIVTLSHYFRVRCLSLILVSQTSLVLPSTILQKSISDIITQLRQYRARQFDFKYRLEYFGDLSLLQDVSQRQELLDLITNNNDEEPVLTVRLGLFYSSFVDLVHKSKILLEQNQLTLQNLKNQYLPVDVLVRTSGAHKLSDVMLFELSEHPTYVSLNEFNPNRAGYFGLYKILTKWQFFRLDREKIMKKNQKRSKGGIQKFNMKKDDEDELDAIRREGYNSEEWDENDRGRAYFMHD